MVERIKWWTQLSTLPTISLFKWKFCEFKILSFLRYRRDCAPKFELKIYSNNENYVRFRMLYKVILTSKKVGKSYSVTIQMKATEQYFPVVLFTVYYSVQGGSNFWVCEWNPKVWPFKWKLLSSTFLWHCLLFCTRWF